MRIKDDLVLREIAGEYIVVPVGSMTVDMRCMIKLNEPGAFLWKQLEKDMTRDELLSAMLEEYDVDADTAFRDINQFLERVQEAGLLE